MSFYLETAIEIATSAHYQQKDMGQQPYILHPLRVMMKQPTIHGMMAGILHDTLEDTHLTDSSLRLMGCPEEVIEAVKLLTHPKGITDDEYLESVKHIKLNPIARSVKIADLEDNMEITRIRGRREGLNERDMKRLRKYLTAYTILKGE